MFIIQRLGRDACWHGLPDEYYSIERVACYRAYELSCDIPDRIYRVKDESSGKIVVTYGPDGLKISNDLS